METTTLADDIKVFYITATSFPGGVKEAHEKLHSLISFSTSRKYFGISRPENGVIDYKAAAEEINPGEAEKLNCDTMVLKKGNYTCITVHDFMMNIPAIGQSFQKLIDSPGIDPNGYCVEWYISDKDLMCMVRLDQ